MTWTPLPRHELDAMIAEALAEYDEDVRADWARIAIEPEKWRCSPWGDLGGGFWAVAVDGDQVTWFNDIEDGFNVSRFSERGTIGEYWCNQDELSLILDQFAWTRSEQAWATLRDNDVPDELRGPGTIVHGRSTYWELRAASGAVYRVHLRDEVERRLATADYPDVELAAHHPLLAQHEEPSRSLYFAGTPIDPRRLAGALDAVIRAGSVGWRGLADYAGDADSAERVLRGGHGLLMRAPASVCAAVAAALEAAGVAASIISDGPANPGLRALVLGRSYLIARAFGFERTYATSL